VDDRLWESMMRPRLFVGGRRRPDPWGFVHRGGGGGRMRWVRSCLLARRNTWTYSAIQARMLATSTFSGGVVAAD